MSTCKSKSRSESVPLFFLVRLEFPGRVFKWTLNHDENFLQFPFILWNRDYFSKIIGAWLVRLSLIFASLFRSRQTKYQQYLQSELWVEPSIIFDIPEFWPFPGCPQFFIYNSKLLYSWHVQLDPTLPIKVDVIYARTLTGSLSQLFSILKRQFC